MRRRVEKPKEELQTAVVLAQLNAVVDRLEGVYEQLRRLVPDEKGQRQSWKN